MRHVWWGIATATAFLVGVLVGHNRALEDDLRATAQQPPASGAPTQGPPGDRPAEDWQAALDRLDAVARQDEAAAAVLAAELLDAVAVQARDGDLAGAQRRLQQFLQHNPYDPGGYLLEAQLWQLGGRKLRALDPLLELLAFADTPEVIGQARTELEQLVGSIESELAAGDDLPAVIRLFEDLTVRDPQYDGHRLRLARWLLRAERLDEAQRVLAETGSVGVNPTEREDLVAAVTLARQGLPIEREAGPDGRPSSLHVQARVGAVPVRLLLDTGATTTALARDRAAALGARPTGERVRVRTANGVVEAEIGRLSDVRVGALHLETLDVILLEEPLPDADGLLGMDVLGHFPEIAGALRLR